MTGPLRAPSAASPASEGSKRSGAREVAKPLPRLSSRPGSQLSEHPCGSAPVDDGRQAQRIEDLVPMSRPTEGCWPAPRAADGLTGAPPGAFGYIGAYLQPRRRWPPARDRHVRDRPCARECARGGEVVSALSAAGLRAGLRTCVSLSILSASGRAICRALSQTPIGRAVTRRLPSPQTRQALDRRDVRSRRGRRTWPSRRREFRRLLLQTLR